MSKGNSAAPVFFTLVIVLAILFCFALLADAKLAAERDAAKYKRLYDNCTDHYKSENQRAEWILDRYYTAKSLLNARQRAEFQYRVNRKDQPHD